MTPIEETVHGTLVFLECGCSAWRGINHPTGKAVLVQIIQACAEHAHEPEQIRAVKAGERVERWTRTPVCI
jgi:hypothetical protein